MHFHPIEPMADDMHTTSGFQVETPHDNTVDDVWGSAPSSPMPNDAVHPSDMLRLQREHTTAGYREGITVAKEGSMQKGFDEGFSLGASVGLVAGQLLGMLEGIAEAVRGREDDDAKTTVRLLSEAKEDLSMAKIFGVEYWEEDGNWKFDVVPKNGGEILFSDVAGAHPLVRKWMQVVDEQIKLWGVDRALLEDETGVRLERVVDEGIATSSAAPVARKPLDW
jgi:hypothetical protein